MILKARRWIVFYVGIGTVIFFLPYGADKRADCLRKMTDYLGLEVCNEQEYCIGRETFRILAGK